MPSIVARPYLPVKPTASIAALSASMPAFALAGGIVPVVTVGLVGFVSGAGVGLVVAVPVVTGVPSLDTTGVPSELVNTSPLPSTILPD